MSTSVWAVSAFQLHPKQVLRFLRESPSHVRAVEVRLFNTDTLYRRKPIGSRRWEPIGDLKKTAEAISKYIADSGLPEATIIRDDLLKLS